MTDMTNLEGDKVLDELLELSDEAERRIAQMNIDRAIEMHDMSPDLARRLFGVS